MKKAFKVPIFLLAKDNRLQSHINLILNRAGYEVKLFDYLDEAFWNSINYTTCAIVFLESSILKSYGILLYDEIFKRCPNAKVVLLCSENDRNLIKHAMEKGGYGSVLEPYDSWEITTMVKHLISDLLVKKNNFTENGKLNERTP